MYSRLAHQAPPNRLLQITFHVYKRVSFPLNVKNMRFSVIISFFAGFGYGINTPCKGSGKQAIGTKCNQFVNCINGNGVIQTCELGKVFHSTMKVCVHSWQCINCCLKVTYAQPTVRPVTTTTRTTARPTLKPTTDATTASITLTTKRTTTTNETNNQNEMNHEIQPNHEPQNELLNEPPNEPHNKPGNEPQNEPQNEPPNESQNDPETEPQNEPQNKPRNEPRTITATTTMTTAFTTTSTKTIATVTTTTSTKEKRESQKQAMFHKLANLYTAITAFSMDNESVGVKSLISITAEMIVQMQITIEELESKAAKCA